MIDRHIDADLVTQVKFTGISRPVVFVGCQDLIPVIRSVLRGWPMREIDVSPCHDAVITIRKETGGYRRGYRRESHWLSRPTTYPNPVNAVCDFLVDLIKAYVAEQPSMLCLHTAVVELAGGLVIFPNTYKAGKSTLSIHFAAAGLKLYADDVLPIEGGTNQDLAPGLLPRLRVPLPKDAGLRFDDFVDLRRGPSSDRFLYIDLGEDELAAFGDRAPVCGIVLLERDEVDSPTLAASEALKRAIAQNFARGVPALDILDRLHALANDAQCWELRYRSGEDAVALLCDAFGEN
jgi:hypothetical protein